MKTAFRLCLFLLSSWVALGRDTVSHPIESRPVVSPPTSIEVYFSPKGGCEAAILNELKRTHQSVLVLAYSFTSVPIAEALCRAKDRRVDVRVILDKSHRKSKHSVLHILIDHHIPVFIDVSHAIAHNKVMILDGQHIISGSYNFTSAAENRNAENLLIIRNAPKLANIYTREWYRLYHKAIPLSTTLDTPPPSQGVQRDRRPLSSSAATAKLKTEYDLNLN